MSDLKEKLEAAGQKAVAETAERKRKAVKGSHLTETFVKMATDAGCDIRSDKSYHVIVGKAGKANRISVAQRGGQVYLVGFNVPGAKEITREAAKARHIGRAMGELDFSAADEAILAIYTAALEVINVPAPAEEPKKERKPRAKKEEATPCPDPKCEVVGEHRTEDLGNGVVVAVHESETLVDADPMELGPQVGLTEEEQIDADLASAGDLDLTGVEDGDELEEGEEVVSINS